MRTSEDPLVVVVTAPFELDDELVDALRQVVPDTTVHSTPYWESPAVRASKGANGGRDPEGHELPPITDDMRAIWAEAHLMVGIDMPVDGVELFPKLEWMQTLSAGVEHLDLDQLRTMGIRLSNASGVGAVPIAEFVMARFLEVWKNLREIEAQQREHVWTEIYGSELTGRTLVIAGLGAIGREVATRARAFGLQVLATRGSAKPGDTDPDVDELHPAAALDELLPRADAVLCSLPATEATADMFDARRFALMPEGAVFQNVGRGTHVVEQDLVDALTSGHLRAGIIDVQRVEPVPTDSPLWDTPNLHLSPHSAVSLDRYMPNAWAITTDNLRRFVAGEPLRNEVAIDSGS